MTFEESQPWRLSILQRLAGAAAVAVVLLAIAPHATGQPHSADADLRATLADLTMQLRLVYRDNVPEYTRRIEQLRDAIVAWNSSSQTNADREQMFTWLRQSIRSSMPGSTRSLPPVPKFAPPPPPPPPPASPPPSPLPRVVEPSSERVPANAGQESPLPLPRSDAATAPQPTPVQTAKPVVPPEELEQLGGNGFWDRHPASHQLPPELSDGDPFLDDPLPAETDADEHSSIDAPPIAAVHFLDDPLPVETEAGEEASADTTLITSDHSPVRVKLTELSARVQGYNMAVRGVEAKLIAGETLSTDERAAIAQQLDQLADEREFLSLYVNGLSPQEQSAVPPLREIDHGLQIAVAKESSGDSGN